MVRAEIISSKIKNSTRMSTLTIFIQHSLRCPSHSSQKRKRSKWNLNKKEEAKLSLCADGMILYIENPKNTTRKLLELISEFCKFAGYKVNISKSVALH